MLLPAWFVLMAFVGAGLMARHSLAFSTPSASINLSRSARAFRIEPASGAWTAVHVLDASCRCSRRIADHLIHDPRPAGWSEHVLWVGDESPPSALTDVMRVTRVSAEALATAGIEAAPLLLALSPRGDVLYAGGYTDRKQGPDVRDRVILDDVRIGLAAQPLPLFGCATSERLHAALARLPVLSSGR